MIPIIYTYININRNSAGREGSFFHRNFEFLISLYKYYPENLNLLSKVVNDKILHKPELGLKEKYMYYRSRNL